MGSITMSRVSPSEATKREHPDIRMEAKRVALDAIAKPVSEAGVAQNWAQPSNDEKLPSQLIEKVGGPGWT